LTHFGTDAAESATGRRRWNCNATGWRGQEAGIARERTALTVEETMTGAGEAPRTARRVLLVEDEAIVAMMLEDMLAGMGYQPEGPAMSVASAMGFLDAGGIDAAILDINVGGGSSEAIADRLRALGLPFAFATGYAAAPSGRFEGTPLLQKPYSEDELKRVLDGFFG
jgi:CheY-like chemotaxis protein